MGLLDAVEAVAVEAVVNVFASCASAAANDSARRR